MMNDEVQQHMERTDAPICANKIIDCFYYFDDCFAVRHSENTVVGGGCEGCPRHTVSVLVLHRAI